MKRKKIIFVLNEMCFGGVGRLLLHLLTGFGDKIEPIVVLMMHKGELLSKLPSSVRLYDLRYKRRLIDLPLVTRRLAKVFERECPDAALSFLWFPNLISIMARILSRDSFRLVISEHSLPTERLNVDPKLRLLRWPVGFLMRWLYPQADGVICVSRAIAEDLKSRFKLGLDSLKVIYNPVDMKKLLSESSTNVDHPWYNRGLPIIISAGRLIAAKNFSALLRVMEKLLKKEIEAKLVILGDGEERANLDSLVDQLSLRDSVAILGFQDKPHSYLARSAVFVLPSLWSEGFGMAALEAMALGVPVVVYDSCGVAEIIKDGEDGLVIPTGDEKALVSAVAQVLLDPQLAKKLGEAASKKAKLFDITRTVAKYEEVLLS
jgi:glycosyltransferase involved in cell wall biosynthesis